MDVISVNIANANSMRVNGRDPYRRRDVVLTATEDGVRIGRMVEDQKPFREVHEPGNPSADARGIVTYSNVEPVFEMVNMISASRAYEANIAAFNSARGMIRSALNIGRV
jgi:flagellar basal-body rod protein FlgC